MRKYLHVIQIGIQNTLVYRVNFLFRVFFGFIPLMATIFLWRAIYKSNETGMVGTYTLSAMTSYYLLVTIVDALTGVNEDDWQIAADIKDGNVSQFILKPMDYLTYRLCLFFSGRLIYTIVAFLPVAGFIFCFRKYFVLPPDMLTFCAFLFSLGLTALLQFFFSFAVALLAFWVLEVSTFIFILFAFEYIAGGHLFPLSILPRWMGTLLAYTPFPYQMYLPVSIYLGEHEGDALAYGLIVQAGWVAFFYMFARFMWSRGLRKYSAVGG